MRNLLRSFLAWLDTRFPQKVWVTQSDYDALKTAINALDQALRVVNDERVKKLEAEINKFNVHLGFMGTMSRPMSQGAYQR